MKQMNEPAKNKGGRPKKGVVKNNRIPVKCTSYEKAVIKANAKNEGRSVSEYLLLLGLKRKNVSKVKTLPKEVLTLTGALNHIGANLNQIAKKRNSITDVLTALDRAELLILVKEIKELVATIKSHLQ